jgi:hypothetical protein
MNIDWDRRLLGPLHAKMGVMATVNPTEGAAFTIRVIRQAPTATLNAFQASSVATDLYVFEARRAEWPDPQAGSGLVVADLGSFELQDRHPDPKQPEIWLLDCVPAA